MRAYVRLTAFLTVALTLTGCHSPYVEATISNRTPSPITLIEVDYPSASFGTPNHSAPEPTSTTTSKSSAPAP